MRVVSYTIFLVVQGDVDAVLYVSMKNYKKEHQKKYRQFLAEIGWETFKRPLLNHRDNTKARESILEKVLAKKCELEFTQHLLPEQGVQGEESTKLFKKVARTERVDEGL